MLGLLAGAVARWSDPEGTPPPAGPGEVSVGTPSGRLPTGAPSPETPRHAAVDALTCRVDEVALPTGECVAWSASDGGVYTDIETSGTVVVAATADGVSAWDEGTGRRLWRWEDPSESAAADLHVSNSTVVVVHEADHRIILLDLFRGAEAERAWSLPIREGRQAWVAVDESTLVVREPASLALYRAGRGPTGPLWELTSEPDWTQLLEPAPGRAPILSDDRVITVTAAGLAAWDRATGEPVWEHPDLRGSPAVVVDSEDVLVTRSGDALLGVSLTDGTVRWERTNATYGDLVALSDGRFAVVATSTVTVHDASTGDSMTTLQPGHVDAAQPGRPGELLLTIGSTVQRWDIELAGPTWTLHGLPLRVAAAPPPVVRTARWGQRLVMTVGNGTILAAIHLPRDRPEAAPTSRQCPDARPSKPDTDRLARSARPRRGSRRRNITALDRPARIRNHCRIHGGRRTRGAGPVLG